MLSSLFDSARRSLRRHVRRGSISSRADSQSRVAHYDRFRNRIWYNHDQSFDENGSDLAESLSGANEDMVGAALGDEGAEEDEMPEDTPLLPIFEASYLDSLPVYSLTHAIRLLVVPRCETTLSWEQLRSPQVSQFMVKPIQKDIIDNHFSKATVYALIANCLQFSKEADSNPSIIGMSRTRAMVCELVAIRILKEYTPRELIDVLSYDFYPMQGMGEISDTIQAPKRPQAARTSTLEVAIRASAKRFLAHPTVVQQLEAIWAGTIVFHHAADAAHRRSPRIKMYGTIQSGTTSGLLSEGNRSSFPTDGAVDHTAIRRTVTLYNPREASLFKLSRLRVPRYRHFMSTCSLAVFLGLFLAVLTERSIHITYLEVVFWFWSAGFTLDEVVGFNEQGFSLYIMSIWNAFDIGILLLLICFYVLRLYSMFLLEGHKKHISDLAFDMLAANAVLLFPRLFSILDHYRYFSQLLIAFRMMAQDLAAVFILIAISCSGFFVAFTMSFGNDSQNAAGTAYALFQMLMGFTPTAWSLWDEYNVLGRVLLILFLMITHYLVVTILVTVLTNSFTAIVQNANDEHQFVFAVNTISMVKSDALFSYIAPSNILGWILTPLRYIMSFRQFVWLNRTFIKVTHLPVLAFIFLYERLVLHQLAYETEESGPDQPHGSQDSHKFDPVGSGMMMFSQREPKLREPSAATFYKDRALAEVFKQPFKDTLQKNEKERKKRADVANWMQNMGADGEVSPPDEQDSDIVDHLERPRFSARKAASKRFTSAMSIATRSLVASDPEEFGVSNIGISRPSFLSRSHRNLLRDELPEQSDNYGDDELVSNDDVTEQITIEDHNSDIGKEVKRTAREVPLQRPRLPPRSLTSGNVLTTRSPAMHRHSSVTFVDNDPIRRAPLKRLLASRPSTARRRYSHVRNLSNQTVVVDPSQVTKSDFHLQNISNTSSSKVNETHHTKASTSPVSAKGPSKTRHLSLTKSEMAETPTSPLIIAPNGSANYSGFKLTDDGAFTKDIASLISHSPPVSSIPGNQFRGALHSSYPRNTSMGFELASDLGDNKAAGGISGGAIPASFATHYDFANRMRRMRSEERHEDDRRMNKLVLARMGALEQSFREVLREVKDMRESERKKKKIRSGLSTPRRDSRVQLLTTTTDSDRGPPSKATESEWFDDEAGNNREGDVKLFK